MVRLRFGKPISDRFSFGQLQGIKGLCIRNTYSIVTKCYNENSMVRNTCPKQFGIASKINWKAQVSWCEFFRG